MKNKNMPFLIVFLPIFLGISPAQAAMWVSAYYAGWSQGSSNNGALPAQNIDYTAVTHIMHFSVIPNADATLDDQGNELSAANSSAAVQAAHKAGKKILFTVGGENTAVGFRGAVSSANRAAFINNLIQFMKTRGYDGIDIDWETLEPSDDAAYSAFINALRTALNAIAPRPLLTAAVATEPALFTTLRHQFDQINLMTYSMSGAWGGWVTWHNGPTYDGGYKFPGGGNLIPSADGMVKSFTSAGVAASVLGIGTSFDSYIWKGGIVSGTSNGVTKPRQQWTTAPTVTQVPFDNMMSHYYQSQYYRWDATAHASYLSIDNAGSANDYFISYDDGQTIADKVAYIQNNGLGGLIIWELGEGYRASQPAGQRDILLQAVKTATNGGVGGAAAPSGLPSTTGAGVGAPRVFPNPWKSDKVNGSPITFTNLIPNATVKIFTVSGIWVRTLQTNSSSIGWDLRNDDGQKVASGLYLYLITNNGNQNNHGTLNVVQ